VWHFRFPRPFPALHCEDVGLLCYNWLYPNHEHKEKQKQVIRIYLDTSVYNRPFDDQTQPRIRLETLAFAAILQSVETNMLTLLSSSIIKLENQKNPFSSRQQWVNYCLNHATHCQLVDESIKERAEQLSLLNIRGMDAFHLACAEAMQCDYFLTVDDRLMKRYKGLLQVKNPVELILLLETNSDDR